MKNIIIYFILFSFLISCKNEKKNIEMSNIESYFPISLNYSYKYYYINTNINPNDTMDILTLAVTDTCFLNKKVAYTCEVRNKEKASISTQFYAVTNDQIFLHSNIINDLLKFNEYQYSLKMPFYVDSIWIPLLDLRNNNTFEYEKNIQNINFYNSNLTGKINIRTYFDKDTLYNYKNELINSKMSILKFSFSGFIQFSDSSKKEIHFETQLRTVFGLNYGILESYVLPTKIDLHFASITYGGLLDKVFQINY